MAFVHEQSCECLKSELDLFSVPPTQTSVENGNWIEYHPLTTVGDDSPIEFEINGNGEDYIDLANTMLYVRAKITNADGTNLAADAVVSPTNLFLHSLFAQVDISLNGTQVTTSTNTYPYRAMIETLLSYGDDAKKSQLTSALFYPDQAGRMDVVNFAEATRNSGLYARSRFTTESRVVDMMGRIHADVFFQDRYLLNEVHVKIKLIRSRNGFCLMSANEFKVKIDSAIMFVRKVKLSPSVFLAQAKALENSTAKYPIRRAVCKTITIPQGFRDVSHEKLFSGQLPTRLVIGLVRHDAFNDTFARNPFNFHHFNLMEISVYSDGQQQYGIKPLTTDFANELYVRAYNTLFSGTGKVFKDEGNALDRTTFSKGYALYAFDLTPDLGEDDHFNLNKQGSVRLVLKFREALGENVTVIAYAEFQNVVEIDRNRNVIYDFAV